MKLTYRPEIDGLRAIAVIAVILYHAQIVLFGHSFFKGGFIGVDIFFVISGYLITSLILKELRATGKFSFLHFYERRARRILPVLFVIMFASLPFAWVYLLPSNFIEFSKSILYSLAFNSNFYFWHIGQEYGAENGLLKPFLHTWSLSVEEQFYVIFPICLIICFKFFRKYLVHILALGFIASLLIAHWGAHTHPSFNFYILPTRGWELLAGSILAYFEINRGKRTSSKLLNQTFSTISIFLIGFSLIFYDDKMLHPSFYTLLPIIGSSLLIWFANKDTLITKILSSKPFVGTGLISYSLYLWHYPVFAFYRISGFAFDNLITNGFICILLFALSILTFNIIEKPFRNKSKIPLKLLIISLSGALITSILINYYVISQNGFKERFKFGQHYILDTGSYLEEWKKFKIKAGTPEFKDTSKINVLIIGNSHATDSFNLFYLNKNLYPNHEFSIIHPPAKHARKHNYQIECFNRFLQTKDTSCKKIDYGENIATLFKQANLIILSARWKNNDLKLLDNIIAELKSRNKKILIFNNTLQVKLKQELNPLDYFVWINRRLPENDELHKIEKEMFNQLNNKATINNKLLKIAENNKVRILLKENYLCDFVQKRCIVLTADNRKISWDYGHYTIDGAKYLGQKIHSTGWFNSD